jgi:hypothetical protein
MKYEVFQVVMAIPYKNDKEKQEIIKQYRKDSILKDYKNFMYVERIEVS